MLIDSPVFTKLRLQLLSPERYPDLMRAMYSLLMLCPQSRAFHTLHARLSSVPTLALLKLNDPAAASLSGEFDAPDAAAASLPWAEMLQARTCRARSAVMNGRQLLHVQCSSHVSESCAPTCPVPSPPLTKAASLPCRLSRRARTS